MPYQYLRSKKGKVKPKSCNNHHKGGHVLVCEILKNRN